MAKKRKANSIQKGKAYERQTAVRWRANYPEACRGNQDNMVNTEADVEGTPFRIECKNHDKIGIFRFWEQAQAEQALHGDERPICVVVRESQKIKGVKKEALDLAAVDEAFLLVLLDCASLSGLSVLDMHREAEKLKEDQRRALREARQAKKAEQEEAK